MRYSNDIGNLTHPRTILVMSLIGAIGLLMILAAGWGKRAPYVRIADVAWAYHESEELGVSVPYPGDLAVSLEDSPDGPRLHFLHWGPTQRVSNAFYDGMSFSIARVDLPPDQTLEEFIEMELTEVRATGVILEPLTTITIDDREGLQFGAFTDNAPFRRAYISMDGNAVLVITSAAPDPTSQGYHQIIEQMLAGFEVQN